MRVRVRVGRIIEKTYEGGHGGSNRENILFFIYYFPTLTLIYMRMLYYIIKNRSIYIDEMIRWLHWLYDFT